MNYKFQSPNGRPPRLSIGLPVYNGERYLRETLESLLAQTWGDFELIISDNCSTDKTEAICSEYVEKDARIRYIRLPRNNGAVANFNSIVAHAKGEYFKWAAHDDLCAPTFLERCVEVLDKDPSVVLCHSETGLIDNAGQPLQAFDDGRMYYFDEAGKIIYLGTDSPTRKLGSDRADERFKAVILQTNWVYEIFGVFRISALKRTGLMKAFYGGDKLLLAQIATMGRITIIPEKLFLNRRHPEQSMSQTAEGREAWVSSSTTMNVLQSTVVPEAAPPPVVTLVANAENATALAKPAPQRTLTQRIKTFAKKETWVSLRTKSEAHVQRAKTFIMEDTPAILRAKTQPYINRIQRVRTFVTKEAWALVLKKTAPYISRLQRMKGFVSAAFGGEMSYSERLGCLKIVTNYYFRFNRWHDMLEDITGLRRRRLAQEATIQRTSIG